MDIKDVYAAATEWAAGQTFSSTAEADWAWAERVAALRSQHGIENAETQEARMWRLSKQYQWSESASR